MFQTQRRPSGESTAQPPHDWIVQSSSTTSAIWRHSRPSRWVPPTSSRIPSEGDGLVRKTGSTSMKKPTFNSASLVRDTSAHLLSAICAREILRRGGPKWPGKHNRSHSTVGYSPQQKPDDRPRLRGILAREPSRWSVWLRRQLIQPEEFISRRIAELDDGTILDIYFRSWVSMITEICK